MSDAFHVMLDIETLGLKTGSAILSIGAVAFDPVAGTIRDDTFYTTINTQSCIDAGLTIDPDTLQWWAKQEAPARKVLHDAANDSAPSLAEAIDNFNQWYQRVGGKLLWGNGASFDNALLRHAAHAVDRDLVPTTLDDRCYRTLKEMTDIPIKRVGVYHNALHDAISQAQHMITFLSE